MHLKKKRYMHEERDDTSAENLSISYNMADNTREVRIEEQLKVKIAEAKKLSSRNAANTSCSTQGTLDVYCTVALDQEEICRTPTISGCEPFFGEEYQFKIPRRFRYLSIYVWDRDRHLKQDKPIGKIAIKREELHKYNHKDHWFSLRPVDSDSEVQGMAHIEVQFEEVPSAYERNSEVIEEIGNHHHHHHHQHQAHQNDYKENSELSNIQRGMLKSRGLFGTPSNSAAVWKSAASTGGNYSRVSIRVPECVDLAKKNGTCDPYVAFTAVYSNKRTITEKTKVRKKTVNPEFDEEVHFDLCIDADAASSAAAHHDANSGVNTNSNNAYTIYPHGGADLCEIIVTLWHSDKVFLGEVKIPMHQKQQRAAVQQSAWYFLQPRSASSSCRSLAATPRSCATPPGTRLSCDSTNGSLRLNLLYTADHVFPLATYDDVMNLLLESVDQRPITISAVSILGELVSSKTDMAQPLVRIFTYKGRIAPIIKALADHEISNLTDPTTIFRGNTLVSKMMDEAMRLSGLHYLHQTLRPVLAQILAEKKPCEIDPSKVKDRSAVYTNLNRLQDYVERVFEAITKSATRCPKVLCQIFYDLRECAERHFPHNREVRYSVVSGFIFLRFFAPAILGPKLFDLTTEPLDCQTNRTLTLISKTIQSLGNLVSSRSSQQPCKEEYTGQLYKKFCTEKHVDAVKNFLEVISTPMDDAHTQSGSCSLLPLGGPADGILEPVLLKEGMMAKYPQYRKRYLKVRSTFKQRYFRLTTHTLSYSKSKGKQPICDIPLAEIERVEQLNEKNFKMQNCFKIVRKDRSLIVQTTNCVEQREWVDLLHKICYTNSIRLQYFHPSAFVNGVYSCCERSDENAPGCKNISAEAMNDFQMDLVTALDPALDLQRIHTLIMSHMTQLEALLDPIAFPHLQQHNPLMPTALALQQQSAQDYVGFQTTIEQLCKVAYAIDKDHRNYKQGIACELKYGSRQAPIGDDNYLHMMHAAGHLNLQQQQQHHATGQVLPQMQHVMAYPYQLQQQHQLQHGNMNPYFMHHLQPQQQQHHHHHHHQLPQRHTNAHHHP